MSARRAEPEKSGRLPGPPARPAHLVIDDVQPQIDCGRHPVKRVVGDELQVTARVYKGGHELLSARLLVREPDARSWRVVPMTYDINFDSFSGAFALDRVGRWTYTVEACANEFATWRDELEKKLNAGLNVTLELLEGAAIMRAAAQRGRGKAADRMNATADFMADEKADQRQRARAALDPDLAKSLPLCYDPERVARYDRNLDVVVDRQRASFGAWYEMFPRSQSGVAGAHGTFNSAARELDRLAELGFDVIYLPPIHPVGHSMRKGRNNRLTAGPNDPGSPWAIGSEAGGHTAVEPKLGSVSDFEKFVEAARRLNMEVALDYALQCSPDHPWLKEHPDWFIVRPDGSIKHAENPPKKYEDIVPLDFWCEDWRSLWEACRDILVFWIERGVRVFRVDNPHTKPFAFWEWAIKDIQSEHPDVIFLAEAFTRPARMLGLAKLGFTQSYTYFTWRNSVHDLRDYMLELARSPAVEYFRPNFFTNTPDILHEYLQSGGRPAFLVRLLLAATLSPNYGIYSGFELCENQAREEGSEEYLNSEKYEVKNRDWAAPGNINEEIGKLNSIRRENPALQRLDNISFLHSENDRLLFYRKSAPGNELLIVVNLDPDRAHQTTLHVPIGDLGIGDDESYVVEDLLTGKEYGWRGATAYVRLDPAERVGHVLRVRRPSKVGKARA